MTLNSAVLEAAAQVIGEHLRGRDAPAVAPPPPAKKPRARRVPRVKELVEGGRTRYAAPTSGPAPAASGLARGSSSPRP